LGENTLMKASDKYPVSIYAKDFNTDGVYDAIPTVFYQDSEGNKKEVTFHGRDDLSKQMNTMRKKFPNFQQFAKATINDVLTEDDLKDAQILKANFLKTAYVENLGKGEFKISAMPKLLQTAPINGMIVEDFDADGNLDVLTVGNDYGTEVSVGRFDAFNGMLLKGNGKGDFVPQGLNKTAFCVSGDAKGLVKINNSQGKPLIMATQNLGALKVYKVNQILKTQNLKPEDVVVLEKLANGKIRKREIGFGTSFLSQSSRSILLSPQVKSVKVIDTKGKNRQL
jgi:enediyne biosynthesis protein E4